MVQGGAWKGLYLVCYYSILVISTQCSLDDKIEYMVIKFGQQYWKRLKLCWRSGHLFQMILQRVWKKGACSLTETTNRGSTWWVRKDKERAALQKKEIAGLQWIIICWTNVILLQKGQMPSWEMQTEKIIFPLYPALMNTWNDVSPVLCTSESSARAFVKAGSLGFSLKGNQTGSPEEISKYQKCV